MEPAEKVEKGDRISDFIDYLFSFKKDTYYLVGIFLLGFILRLIAAVNLSVSADDMHHVSHAINFISAERLITYDQSAGLWHAFTSVMYSLFGLTQLSSRLAALIFGSFTILVIYLLSKEFFGKKTSLVAMFLMAIAPFHIKLTIAEQDVMAMFFVLLGMLSFVKALKSNKTIMFTLSGVLVGLAVYTKVYPILFVPSLLIFFAYFRKKSGKKIINKDQAKKLLIFLLLIFIFTVPALTHNYLLYKDKGFLDLQFTRTFGLGRDISAQYYSWDHQFTAKNDWNGLIFGNSSNLGSQAPTLLAAISYIRVGDPINFYLGILGLLSFFLYRKESRPDRGYLWFFVLSTLFALPFLASIILLPKHYVFLEILIVPLSAIAITRTNWKLFKSSSKTMTTILLILLIISLAFLGLTKKGATNHFYGESGVSQLIKFKEGSIPENALLVSDSRIYRGTIYWASQNRLQIEGSDFIQTLNPQNQLPGEPISIDTYFIECVTDDCGWGTISDQPEFNQTMELLAEFFKNQGKLVEEIKEPDKESSYYPFQESKLIDVFNIYSYRIQVPSSVLSIAAQPKTWFLYTIGYEPKEQQFDYYETHGFIDKTLNKVAHWVVLLALILAFIAPIYVIYLIKKR